MVPLDGFSRSAVLLTAEYRNESDVVKSWQGTGIIRYLGGRVFLATALHNLTGREPSGKCKDTEHGCLPNYIKAEGFHTRFEARLYEGNNGSSCDQPLYWIHPDGAKVDIGVLPVGFGAWPNATVDESFFDERKNALETNLYPTQDCFILGFPENLVDRSDPNFPRAIFKTAHVAFDPRVDFQGEPVVLIDAVTRPGESGSPVFATGISYNGFPVASCLVGIYSGRYLSFSDSGRELAHLSNALQILNAGENIYFRDEVSLPVVRALAQMHSSVRKRIAERAKPAEIPMPGGGPGYLLISRNPVVPLPGPWSFSRRRRPVSQKDFGVRDPNLCRLVNEHMEHVKRTDRRISFDDWLKEERTKALNPYA
jgi:hypothetical protein